MYNTLINPIPRTEKYSLTVFHIKLLAFCLMVADHIGTAFVLPHIANSTEAYSTYVTLNLIGRFAFPLYLFLIIEGIKHTRSGVRYAGRILFYAVCSELFFDYALSGHIDFSHQNAMFTLFIGVTAVFCSKSLVKSNNHKHLRLLIAYIIIPAAAAFSAWLIRSDYGAYGIVALYAMYIADKRFGSGGTYLAGSAALCLMSPVEAVSLIATPLLSNYEGAHGRRIPAALWYSLYPGHLAVIALIRLAI